MHYCARTRVGPDRRAQEADRRAGIQDVLKVTKGNCYELYGSNPAGKRVEIYYRPDHPRRRQDQRPLTDVVASPHLDVRCIAVGAARAGVCFRAS